MDFEPRNNRLNLMVNDSCVTKWIILLFLIISDIVYFDYVKLRLTLNIASILTVLELYFAVDAGLFELFSLLKF